MAYISKWKGQEIDDSIQKVVDKSNVWDNKQDKLTGREGQVVGFDALHNAIAIDLNDSDTVTSFNGRSGDVLPQTGDYTAAMVGAKDADWMPTPADIGALGDDTFIPTKTSELENDSGYITADDIGDIDLSGVVKVDGGATLEVPSEIGEAPHVITFTLEDGEGSGGSTGGGTVINGLPAGGLKGQVLSKKSNNDYDTEWVNMSSGGGSGSSDASEIRYDNSGSSLSAGTVKGAIDELDNEKLDKVSGSSGQYLGFDSNGNIVAVYGPNLDELENIFTPSKTFGNGNTATGMSSAAIGNGNIANGNSCVAIGYNCKAGTGTNDDYGNIAIGNNSSSAGYGSIAMGNSTVNGLNSFGGNWGVVSSDYSTCFGQYTISKANNQFVIGSYNKTSTSGGLSSGDKLIIGCGDANAYRANCMRVSTDGAYGIGAWNTSGADYAEMFEWDDGNPKNEDRRGRFVTLNGSKIKLANPNDDYIIGVVSGSPSVVGDVNDDQWQGMYMRDIFGKIIYEEVEIPEESIKVPSEKNPKRMVKKVISPKHKEMAMKLNPEYDHTQTYVPRSERKEWDAVGLLGKLVMVDDGLCEVNSYCKPGENGIAVWSKERTKYRVMERLDDNHIRVMIL